MEERLFCTYDDGIFYTSECSCFQGVYSCNVFNYGADTLKPGINDNDDTLSDEGMDDALSSNGNDKNQPVKGKKKGKKEKKAKTEGFDPKGKKGKKWVRNRK
jgi:hypothetical protein